MWAIFVLNGMIPLLFVSPFVSCLVEVHTASPPSVGTQMMSIWSVSINECLFVNCTLSHCLVLYCTLLYSTVLYSLRVHCLPWTGLNDDVVCGVPCSPLHEQSAEVRPVLGPLLLGLLALRSSKHAEVKLRLDTYNRDESEEKL